MPIRKFQCQHCGTTWEALLAHGELDAMCSCGQIITYVPSSGGGVKITEKVGKYWDKNLEVGIKEKMQERSTEHMRTVEMHDIIAKHGIKSLKNHPLIKDNNIKKKSEL